MAALWLKFSTDFYDDEDITGLVLDGRYDAVCFYIWLLCKAKKLADSEGRFCISTKIARRDLRLKPKQFRTVFGVVLVRIRNVFVQDLDGTLHIHIRKWSKYQSSWGGKRQARFEQDLSKMPGELRVKSLEKEEEEVKVEPPKNLKNVGNQKFVDPIKLQEARYSPACKKIRSGILQAYSILNREPEDRVRISNSVEEAIPRLAVAFTSYEHFKAWLNPLIGVKRDNPIRYFETALLREAGLLQASRGRI